MRELAERAAEEAARSEEETARAEDEAARAEEFATQADEARERLESVLAGISDGFLVMDRDLTVLYVNPQGAAMLGRSPEELLQRPLWERVPADATSTSTRSSGRRSRAGTSSAPSVAWRAPSAGSPPTCIPPAAISRSSSRTSPSAMRPRAGLAKATSACVWPSTPAGSGCGSGTSRRPGSCGPTAPTSCTGSRSGSFGGRLEDFAGLVHPDDTAKVNDLIQTAIREHNPVRGRVPRRPSRRDGALARHGRSGAVRPGRAAARMLGVTWERTEQRLAEEAARHGQRMEAIGRLAGGIAHEVNNQMAVVLGFAQFILKRTDLAPDLRADVAEIHRAGERSASITSQLLAFSRRQLLRPESLDLSAVVASFERVLKRTVGERCELTLDLATTLPAIEADRGQLEQILLNLALNAADAMPSGGSLRVTTGTADMPKDAGALGARVTVAPGHYVRLEVNDSGQGMDAGALRHMFEPFFTTKPVGKGTGLGLSTVYGIVKQSGGYVWVDSTPGAGTSVHLFFPAAPGLVPVPAAPPTPRTTPARGVVMVVEDEPAVRAMVSRILEAEGYDVIAAQHGRDALDVLERRDGVRLVVSDVAMPVMGGREARRPHRAAQARAPGALHVGIRRR